MICTTEITFRLFHLLLYTLLRSDYIKRAATLNRWDKIQCIKSSRSSQREKEGNVNINKGCQCQLRTLLSLLLTWESLFLPWHVDIFHSCMWEEKLPHSFTQRQSKHASPRYLSNYRRANGTVQMQEKAEAEQNRFDCLCLSPLSLFEEDLWHRFMAARAA